MITDVVITGELPWVCELRLTFMLSQYTRPYDMYNIARSLGDQYQGHNGQRNKGRTTTDVRSATLVASVLSARLGNVELILKPARYTPFGILQMKDFIQTFALSRSGLEM